MIDRIRAEGVDFVIHAVREPDWLDEVTGMAELKKRTKEMLEAHDIAMAMQEGPDQEWELL